MDDLKQAVSNYFAQKAEDEINRMWDEGTLTEEKVESFRTLHERTPYSKQPSILFFPLPQAAVPALATHFSVKTWLFAK